MLSSVHFGCFAGEVVSWT